MVTTPPKVFISYSHDFPGHAQHVLELAERLRQDGIDAQLDQYVAGMPAEGWPRWMLDRLDWADFVLVVCTETYYRRFRGREESGKGKGADWEGNLITLQMYNAKSRTTKFAPVFFASQDEQFVPEPLRGYTQYLLNSEENYTKLYAFLTGQVGVPLAELGAFKTLPRKKVEPLTFGKQDEKALPTGTTEGVPERFAAQNSSERVDQPVPLTVAAPRTLPVAQLSLKQKMELVNVLLAVPVVHEPETRKNILSAMMPREMINRIRHAYDDHTHVFNIVETCLRHPGGMEELVRTVREFDSGTYERKLFDETLKRLIP
jgi:SEFIR domain-containing protein/effector-associated domain 2 (EAD2)-containing protein